MPEIDAGTPAFYDHQSGADTTRERRAPDWGGDELFSEAPRRRFTRPDRPHMRVHPLGVAAPDPAEHRVIESHVAPSSATHRRDPHGERPERAANGRRTVTITGRPGALTAPRPAAIERRRPAPTVADRIGGRPDRIAGWAFGLGLTLILVAVSTADAAVI